MKKFFITAIIISLISSNVYAKNSIDVQEAANRQATEYFNGYNNSEYATKIEALDFIINVYDIGIRYYYDKEQAVNNVPEKFSSADDEMTFYQYQDILFNGKMLGIISEYENDFFSPDDLITKEDFYVMLYNLIKSEKVKQYECDDLNADTCILNNYSDKNNISSYAEDAIAFFVKNNIITERNMLNPKNNITNSEMLELKTKINKNFKRKNFNNYITRIDCLAELNDYYYSGTEESFGAPQFFAPPEFMDMNVNNLESSYKRAAAAFGKKNNIVNGYSDGTFDPEAYITKEDLYTMLYNLVKSDSITTFNIDNTDADINILKQYSDFDNINEYAKVPLAFFADKGLVNVSNNKINPKGNITEEDFLNIKEKVAENIMIKEKYEQYIANISK